jgi:hypothetical protein
LLKLKFVMLVVVVAALMRKPAEAAVSKLEDRVVRVAVVKAGVPAATTQEEEAAMRKVPVVLLTVLMPAHSQQLTVLWS